MSSFERLLIGRVFAGRYEVLSLIGRGGMGSVFRARDQRLDRDVALKVIAAPPGLGEQEIERMRARFRREARLAASISHPNVVTTFDYGTDPDLDQDYVAMELLAGEDLARRLERFGPLPAPAAAALLLQAAEGLAEGHERGIVHRDVKPANLFISDTPRGPRLRVLDFGIAQPALSAATATRLTQMGSAPHSPVFSAPEQLQSGAILSPAADVYSLGMTGIALLIGRSPEGPRIPPGTHPRLATILQRALQADPGSRYADGQAMAAALSGALTGYAGSQAGTEAPAPAPPAPHAAPADRTVLAPAPRVPGSARRAMSGSTQRARQGGHGWLAIFPVLAALGLGYILLNGTSPPPPPTWDVPTEARGLFRGRVRGVDAQANVAHDRIEWRSSPRAARRSRFSCTQFRPVLSAGGASTCEGTPPLRGTRWRYDVPNDEWHLSGMVTIGGDSVPVRAIFMRAADSGQQRSTARPSPRTPARTSDRAARREAPAAEAPVAAPPATRTFHSITALDLDAPPRLANAAAIAEALATHHPASMRAAGEGGYVQLRIIVDEHGVPEPGGATIVRLSDERLRPAAQEIIPRLRFVPLRLDGRPIKTRIEWYLSFPA